MIQRLKIIVPSYNSMKYLPKTLASIEAQTCEEYDVCVIDDASMFPEQRELIRDYCERNQWKFHFNKINQGALYNVVYGIEALNCEDDDVIFIIDGDDWLAEDQVFEKIYRLYEENDLYFTWGRSIGDPPTTPPTVRGQPVPDRVIDNKFYRDIRWVFWHPVTFKYYLWRHIKREDLLDEDGHYYRILKDLATHLPLLEMAGRKIHFIEEGLYIYNVGNPLKDFETMRKSEFERVKDRIRSLPKYETLPRCR